jgi:hypothetical protein
MRIEQQDILEDVEVKVEGEQMVLTGRLCFSLPLPQQDVPNELESEVNRAGPRIQRAMLRALLEQADRQEVLRMRQGKAGMGIRQRGTRPYHFKARCGDVLVQRCRIQHRVDGAYEVPSATAWNTPARTCILRGLRDAACDLLSDQTVRPASDRLAEQAGQEKLLGYSTAVELLHESGEALMSVALERAETILDQWPEARQRLATDTNRWPTAVNLRRSNAVPVPSCEVGEEEWLPAAVGFLGVESEAEAIEKSCPRQVDPGFVCLQADEVKVKAQAGSGRQEHYVYTATVLVEQLQYYFAAATPGHLALQVGGLLCLLGVLSGSRKLLMLADGAAWIRHWFQAFDLPGKAMILCWYHLVKRCIQQLSAAGLGNRKQRKPLEKELLDHLWHGAVEQAVAVLARIRAEARRPDAIDYLIEYLNKRRPYLPDYSARHAAGLWIASNRVEKWNDWAVADRCKRRGMSWAPLGVLSLALLEAARRNKELDTWRKEGVLHLWTVPTPSAQAA